MQGLLQKSTPLLIVGLRQEKSEPAIPSAVDDFQSCPQRVALDPFEELVVDEVDDLAAPVFGQIDVHQRDVKHDPFGRGSGHGRRRRGSHNWWSDRALVL